jgi:hypothetical protein
MTAVVYGPDVVVALVAIGVYLLPTIIAGVRHSTRWTAIFALNLFLGWTFIGWIGALVWACTSTTSMPTAGEKR